MDNKELLTYFGVKLKELSERFYSVAMKSSLPETVAAEIYQASAGYDIFNYNATLIRFELTRTKSSKNAIQFLISSMDVLNLPRKAELQTTKGIVTNEMLTSDLILIDDIWHIYEPLDIESILSGISDKSASSPIVLTDEKIENILKYVFDDVDNYNYKLNE